MCTGTPFNNGPRDMAALQSYVDASSPAAEEKWWKEAVSGKGGPEIARAVRDWRENGGMVRRNLDVLTTQLPQLDVTTENVILDDDELFAYLSVEINQCVRPAWRYYLLFWPPRRSARVLGARTRRLRLTHPNV